MKTTYREAFGSRWKSCAVVALLTMGASLNAFAALGGTADSIQADQTSLRANIKVTDEKAYTVHEMKSPTGTVVREYVSTTGRVFGVTWEGPFIPDMRQLLGAYFDQFSRAARVQRENHVGRRPLNINDTGLVVQTAGHMRAYSGRAFDPTQVPSEVRANDIR